MPGLGLPLTNVCRVRETWTDRQLADDEQLTRTLVRSFDVWMAALNVTMTEVRTAVDPDDGTAVPSIGDAHPDWPAATCVRVRVRQDTENPARWFADAEYTTLTDPGAADPLMEPPDIDWDGVSVRKAVDRSDLCDADGAVISTDTANLNSAGDPYEPPPEKDHSRLSVAITVNRVGYNAAEAQLYLNAINDADWYGWPAWTVRVKNIRARMFRKNNTYYFRTTYVLEFNPDTWDRFELDRGFRELFDDEPVEIVDARAGMGPSGAYLLDGEGARLPPDGDPVFRRYRDFEERDFAFLNLPDPTTGP